MNKQQYESVTAWQDQIFTKATPLSCLNHLEEEIGELKKELIDGINDPSEEIADCFLLLFGVCNKLGMSYENIVATITWKMRINRERKWGEVNEKGYVKHIEQTHQP